MIRQRKDRDGLQVQVYAGRVFVVDFTVWRGRHLSGCAAVPRLRAGAGRSTGASP